MRKRPLWETLVDLAHAVMPADGLEAEMIRVTSVEMNLPVEVTVRQSIAGIEFLADMPVWRMSTFFDAPKSRMTILWAEGLAP